MKKLLRIFLLATVLTAALCVGALAAESEPSQAGIYNIVPSNSLSISITPQTTEKAKIDGTTYTSYAGAYYAGAVRMEVEISGLNSGYYMMFLLDTQSLPGDSNIKYVDLAQPDANGKVTFNVYPEALSKGTYYLYLTGGDLSWDLNAPLATFDYYQSYTLGDVNDDGSIDATDALVALQAYAELITLDETQKLAADVNRSGNVDATDALMILQYYAELITDFEVT